MSLTTPAVHVPVHDTIGSWLRRHLGWMLTGVAVAAAAVLLAMIVVGDSGADVAPSQTFSAERGSINAIDHQARDIAVLGHSTAASEDHRAGGGVKVR